MTGSGRTLLVVPVTPADHGNGLAMRAGLLLEGLSSAGEVDVLVKPTSRAVAARSETAGLVVVMRTYMAPSLDDVLGAESRPPVVLDVDDVPERFDEPDARYLQAVDCAFACSTPDARVLEQAGARRVEIVPNAVRPPERTEPAPPPGTGNDLLFVGNLSYGPNVDAAEWLAGEIMPLLDGATLAVVGSNPDPAVRALASDRVRIAADVPDVAPYYADSRVAVVPLRAGGGSRIKVLEAYAHGRPVVATSAGIRGTELGDGPGPALLADDPPGFAAACRRLLDDPTLAARLGAKGSEAAAAEGSIDVVASRIAGIAGAIARPAVARARSPLARSDVEVAEADDGYVVYDSVRDRVHYLNHTAVLVMELCNGQNSEERIAAQLQRAYDLPAAPVQETRACVKRLVEEGLVE